MLVLGNVCLSVWSGFPVADSQGHIQQHERWNVMESDGHNGTTGAEPGLTPDVSSRDS